MTSSFTTEFPDFPVADMPAIPAGFVDRSWGNESCPFFLSEDLGIGIYVDYVDPAAREFIETEHRFTIVQMDASEHGWQHGDHQSVLVTNDWAEVEAFVASLASHADFSAKIETLEQAKAFVEMLHTTERMFHFEDSPELIITFNLPEHSPDRAFFTPAECVLLRLRVAELYSFDWAPANHECPIGYALEVMDREETK